jgi:5-methylcytosine-specific restriction endonuclease McrA
MPAQQARLGISRAQRGRVYARDGYCCVDCRNPCDLTLDHLVPLAQAFGKLYASPVSLQTFEQDAGQTNKSRVRIELHAQIGVERQAAAVRIAAA